MVRNLLVFIGCFSTGERVCSALVGQTFFEVKGESGRVKFPVFTFQFIKCVNVYLVLSNMTIYSWLIVSTRLPLMFVGLVSAGILLLGISRTIVLI